MGKLIHKFLTLQTFASEGDLSFFELLQKVEPFIAQRYEPAHIRPLVNPDFEENRVKRV